MCSGPISFGPERAVSFGPERLVLVLRQVVLHPEIWPFCSFEKLVKTKDFDFTSFPVLKIDLLRPFNDLLQEFGLGGGH